MSLIILNAYCRMDQLKVDKENIAFGQLLGMCDHVTFSLGKSLLATPTLNDTPLFNDHTHSRSPRLQRVQVHALWVGGGGFALSSSKGK